MRGTSSRSLEQLDRSAETVIAGDVVPGGADAGQVAGDLFAVVSVLDSTPTLRRVLTDPSSDDDAKEGLARKVFGGKISDEAVAIVAVGARLRWGSARDLPDALEQAGVSALVASADSGASLDELEDELFRFGRVVMADNDLRSVLADRTVPVAPKVELVDRLLADKVTPATLALVHQAVAGRAGSFETTLDSFGEIAARRRARLVATVRVAAPLDEGQHQRLAAALASQYGQDVHVNTVVDPSVIGGVSVHVGDEIIDGTVAGRLEDARRRITGGA